MLVIRMQRTGRKGHAQFRVVVQDSRRTPTSGRLVAAVGHFNPHAKTAVINKEKVEFYLQHGAQPTDRVVRLLKAEGVKLPKWVNKDTGSKKRDIRNPEKLRKNRPAEEKLADEPADQAEEEAEAPEAKSEEVGQEKPTEAEPKAEKSDKETPEKSQSEEK